MINTESKMPKKSTANILNKSALEENSVTKESIDLIITSPPYNVGVDYGSQGDSLTYEEYLKFSGT